MALRWEAPFIGIIAILLATPQEETSKNGSTLAR